jgi:hypothetical protein
MQTIKRGLAPQREATILQVFLKASGYDVNPDGQFGTGTEAMVSRFQSDNGLVVDGAAGEKTWTTLFAQHPQLLAEMSAKWLSQEDIDSFAAKMALDVPVVRTVYSVESGGMGFIGTQAKILFEGHVFWKQLQAAGIDPAAHAAGNGDILFPEWDPHSYVGGLAEYGRLERARAIAEVPALNAASWGLFQILGLNAGLCGYGDVHAFVAAMSHSEADQLTAFGGFISAFRHDGRPLIDWLKDRNWATFAAGYNGPSYVKNQYDHRLAEAYAGYTTAATG